MDNKYGLGSAKVATAYHEARVKASSGMTMLVCRYCSSTNLLFCATMNDHYCKDCGEYQSDLPAGYATGHPADY
ncbi:MAG: hypothetical protein N2Z69_09235 [Methylophilaceae bacterium]|nr:hypothetical protein [Methylophilaceae bacterium]